MKNKCVPFSSYATHKQPYSERCWFYPSVNIVAAILALGSLALVVVHIACLFQIPRWFRAFIVGFWTIGPPFWLWIEWYHIQKPKLGKENILEKLELVKHGQSVVRALWAALVAVLAVGFGLVGK